MGEDAAGAGPVEEVGEGGEGDVAEVDGLDGLVGAGVAVQDGDGFGLVGGEDAGEVAAGEGEGGLGGFVDDESDGLEERRAGWRVSTCLMGRSFLPDLRQTSGRPQVPRPGLGRGHGRRSWFGNGPGVRRSRGRLDAAGHGRWRF